jgi:hypothetical protein
MAITFPRSLPDVLYTDGLPYLDQGVTASETRGRLVNYTQFSAPLWRVDVSTIAMCYDDYKAFEAWGLSLRGGLRSTLFSPLLGGLPRKHRDDPTPAEDTGSLVEVVGGNVLKISGYSADLEMSVGDFVGLERLTRYYFGMVTDVATEVDPSDPFVTYLMLTVEPPPKGTAAGANATVRFANPKMKMRLVPDSYQRYQNSILHGANFTMTESD